MQYGTKQPMANTVAHSRSTRLHTATPAYISSDAKTMPQYRTKNTLKSRTYKRPSETYHTAPHGNTNNPSHESSPPNHEHTELEPHNTVRLRGKSGSCTRLHSVGSAPVPPVLPLIRRLVAADAAAHSGGSSRRAAAATRGPLRPASSPAVAAAGGADTCSLTRRYPGAVRAPTNDAPRRGAVKTPGTPRTGTCDSNAAWAGSACDESCGWHSGSVSSAHCDCEGCTHELSCVRGCLLWTLRLCRPHTPCAVGAPRL